MTAELIYISDDQGATPYHLSADPRKGVYCDAEIVVDEDTFEYSDEDVRTLGLELRVCDDCFSRHRAGGLIAAPASDVDELPSDGPEPEPASEPLLLTVHDHMARAASGYQRYQRDRRYAIKAYLEGGSALLEARKLAQHGEWLPLLEEFEIPQPTAWRMMRLSEGHGDDADAVIAAGGIVTAAEALTPKTDGEGHELAYCEADDDDGKLFTVNNFEPDPSAEVMGHTPDDGKLFTVNNFEPDPPAEVMGHTPDELADELDRTESENRELRQEVQELKEKPPTRTQKLEAENALLQTAVNEKSDQIETLQRSLNEARAQVSEYPHERETVANEREAMIRTLRGQVAEWQTKYNEELRSRRYWEREAKAHGWTAAEVPA